MSITPQEHVYVEDTKTQLGFWLYLMTDCVLFASLFATFIVLRGSAHHHDDLFSLPFVLKETLLLLTSSFTCGLTLIAARARNIRATYICLAITFLLGAMFLGLELQEFHNLVAEGNGWRVSGFMSAYFTLVGTHGLHITLGLLWAVVLAVQMYGKGFVPSIIKRITLFSMFWHFLDIVWIFIFTVVYLTGAL